MRSHALVWNDVLRALVSALNLRFAPSLNLSLHAGGKLRVLFTDADGLATGHRHLLVHCIAVRAAAKRKASHGGAKEFGHVWLPPADIEIEILPQREQARSGP